ncbi:uncharacterized protein BO97DRAFT_192542 [Aspergillus homomorphus CBS 101889]|uniref:Uncharacterized protein n=1 Tax=Aspergillus homomorphus (strain CBS 101889) TaxID=1450537 RepID=A0A395HMT1_ASPHC|nr:hypothetical protein BO97DRAFT_192542 [Aspergillus homomorphus CBS 101889]RAL08799.1 hypothetical protein BO97DRAFT_192542 [Aspergillus homomorphus CBS 101889]
MSPQTILINYTPDKRLSLMDATTKQPLYHVKVSRQTPQMEMIRLTGHLPPTEGAGADATGTGMRPIPADEEAYFESRVCTAQFKLTSLDVKLRIREQRNIELKRQKVLSTRYSFVSPALSVGQGGAVVLTWETDSENNAVGNFRLVQEGDSQVLVKFRNEAFSNERVGTFEVLDGAMDELVTDEAVISGLAMLAMNQSFNLAGMVMFGRS